MHELWPVTSNTEEHFEVILFLFASFQTVPKSHHNFLLHEISYGYFRRVKYLGVTHSRNFSGFLSPPRKRFPEATCSDLQATSGAEMYPSDFHDLRYDLYKMLRFTGPPRCPLGTRSWEVQRTASHRTALFFFIRTDETETENVSRNVNHACNVSTPGSVTQRKILPIPYDTTQRIKHLDSWLFSR